MKPAPFEYLSPDSLEEALTILQEHGSDAKLLAGGQSLVPAMNFRLAQPGILVDINKLSDLDYIRDGGSESLLLGAMTRQSRLETDSHILERAPLLGEAMPHVAHPQIRNRGTLKPGASSNSRDRCSIGPAGFAALNGALVQRMISSGFIHHCVRA
jgi:carbon-monoxide dehydrogenase medium subunit